MKEAIVLWIANSGYTDISLGHCSNDMVANFLPNKAVAMTQPSFETAKGSDMFPPHVQINTGTRVHA